MPLGFRRSAAVPRARRAAGVDVPGGVHNTVSLGPGWADLVDAFAEELRRTDSGASATVTLDWGLLTFSVRASSPDRRAPVRAVKRRFESLAARTCEGCGADGTIRGGVTMTVSCDGCYAARH